MGKTAVRRNRDESHEDGAGRDDDQQQRTDEADPVGDNDGDDDGDDDLLDDDADDLDDGEDGDLDDDDPMDEVVDEVSRRLEGKIASMFDRRVNAVLKEIRGHGRGGNKRTERHRDRDDRTSTSDVRGARLAFREELSDQVRFISAEERRFAQDLGRSLIEARALTGFEDEDEVGREVADEVAERVVAMRRHYQQRTRQALVKRGLLEDKTTGSPAPGRGKKKSIESEYKDGASLAARRHQRNR